jgi:hypothetical protein
MHKSNIEFHVVCDDGLRHIASFDAESIRSRYGMQAILDAAHKEGKTLVFAGHEKQENEFTAKMPRERVVDVWDTNIDEHDGAMAASVSLDSGEHEWVLGALKECIGENSTAFTIRETKTMPCPNIGPDDCEEEEEEEERESGLPTEMSADALRAGSATLAMPHTLDEATLMTFEEISEIQLRFNGDSLENPASRGMKL